MSYSILLSASHTNHRYVRDLPNELITFISGTWKGTINGIERYQCLDSLTIEQGFVIGPSKLYTIEDSVPKFIDFDVFGGFLTLEFLELLYSTRKGDQFFGRQQLNIDIHNRTLSGKFESFIGKRRERIVGDISLTKL